jgi:hypothetical protein
MPTPEEKAAMEKAAAEKATVNSPMPVQTTMPATVIPGQTNVPVTLPQQPQTMTINPQTVTQTPAPVATQPGMNPPHGQPGHRCDITVGAPLNSKPAPAQPTTVTTAPQQQQVTMKGTRAQVRYSRRCAARQQTCCTGCYPTGTNHAAGSYHCS